MLLSNQPWLMAWMDFAGCAVPTPSIIRFPSGKGARRERLCQSLLQGADVMENVLVIKGPWLGFSTEHKD